MAHTHTCTYCARYARHLYTGEPTGHPTFTGTYADVVIHALAHPIGDPRDMAQPITNTHAEA